MFSCSPSRDLPPCLRGVRVVDQPRPRSGFLMDPPPRPTAQKAAQTGHARLPLGLGPGALHLLPQGVQTPPAQQPTAHHCPLGRGGSAHQGAQQRRRPFVQCPGHQPGTHGRFHTRGMLRPNLVEAQQLFHCFADELSGEGLARCC